VLASAQPSERDAETQFEFELDVVIARLDQILTAG
jgi:hypothetical protein